MRVTYANLIPELKKRDLDVVQIGSTYRLKKANTSAQEHKNVGRHRFATMGEIRDYLTDNPNLCGHNLDMYL